jgi:hypothetical protein
MKGARLAATIVGVAAGAGDLIQSRLSRYPTTTASGVPGHVRSRQRGLTAVSGLVSCSATAFIDAAPTRNRYLRSRIVPWSIQLVESRPTWVQ